MTTDKPSRNVLGWVYVIRCSENGKVYVGSSTNTNRRFYLHRRDLNNGKHHSPALQSAWNKYGEAAFQFEVVQEVRGLAALLDAEQSMIDANKGAVMNCAPVAGSPLGVLRTSEQKKAMSEAKKRFFSTPEGKAATEKARLSRTGRVQSPEERAMRSAALKGKKMGREWTPEQREAHSKALTGRKMPKFSDEWKANISAGIKRARELRRGN